MEGIESIALLYINCHIEAIDLKHLTDFFAIAKAIPYNT